MVSNEFAGGRRELTATLLDTDESCLLIGPSATLLGAVADLVIGSPAELPAVDVLAEAEALKTAREEFQVAAGLVEGIAADRLRIRVFDERADTTLLATSSAVYAVVDGSEAVGALASEAEPLVGGVREAYREKFADADSFDLRRPALSHTIQTLEEQLGEPVGAEFERALEGAERVTGLDAVVTLLVVVTARNEGLLYDLSQWSEDVGLASKATVSRRKSQLEDTGVVLTEKQPIDIGRPRLRLVLDPDSDLAAADPEELWPLTREYLPTA